MRHTPVYSIADMAWVFLNKFVNLVSPVLSAPALSSPCYTSLRILSPCSRNSMVMVPRSQPWGRIGARLCCLSGASRVCCACRHTRSVFLYCYNPIPSTRITVLPIAVGKGCNVQYHCTAAHRARCRVQACSRSIRPMNLYLMTLGCSKYVHLYSTLSCST